MHVPSAQRIAELPSPIDAHVAIGDGRSVALTDGRGAIDWLCWPRFDSAPIFASILDARCGGAFAIAPRGARSSRAGYVGETNVAITRFELDAGVIELVDAMSIDDDGTHERSLAPEHEIVRVVSCQAVEAVIDVSFDPRVAFGPIPRRKIGERGVVRVHDRGRLYTLRASRPLQWREDRDGALRCSFAMRAGERVGFSLSYAADAPLVLTPLGDAGVGLVETTLATWRSWAAKARYEGPYRDAVVRSALALKLLCYAPSGAIIAAPTTSLPERIGGDRNWDYRYCWLRDAAFIARALFGLGYEEEADAFIGWLLHATHLTRPKLRVLYDVYGEQPPAESCIEHAAGYGGARPVRFGNAAMDQVQGDLYGEVIDAVAQAWLRGREPDRAEVALVEELGHYVASTWHRPDQGIWEPREEPAHHTHSRLLSWVALDRLVSLADRGIAKPSARTRASFEEERARIAKDLRERAWSEARGSYVATLDGDRLDAALLLLSWYGFEDPRSPRMASTLAAIDRTLGIGKHLLLRNLEVDDDGGFVACAFWATEHLARGGGTLAEARARFETLLGLAGAGGLYAELVDAGGRHLGNHPQGFSHVALLNVALSLEERERERER